MSINVGPLAMIISLIINYVVIYLLYTRTMRFVFQANNTSDICFYYINTMYILHVVSDFLIYIFIRGCFFVDQTTKGGCYTDTNIFTTCQLMLDRWL
jgi:hypothetical protein